MDEGWISGICVSIFYGYNRNDIDGIKYNFLAFITIHGLNITRVQNASHLEIQRTQNRLCLKPDPEIEIWLEPDCGSHRVDAILMIKTENVGGKMVEIKRVNFEGAYDDDNWPLFFDFDPKEVTVRPGAEYEDSFSLNNVDRSRVIVTITYIDAEDTELENPSEYELEFYVHFLDYTEPRIKKNGN